MRARSLRADLLDRVVEIVLQEPRVLAPAALRLGNPLPREFALLNLRENLFHFPLGRLVDHARSAREVAVLRGLADEAVHLGDAALVQQIDDELELVQALVIGDGGLIAGLDQRLVTLDDELRGASAEHGLLAEQIGFGLFGEGGLEHTAARAADAVGIRERDRLGVLGGILSDRDQARHAAALLILAAHEIAGTLGRDQHHVQILARLDLLEVDVEAVRKEQRRPFSMCGFNSLIERLLRHVRHEHGDEARALDGSGGLGHLQAVLLGLVKAVPLRTPTTTS